MDMVHVGTVSFCLVAQQALVYFELDVGTASVSVTGDVQLRADSAGLGCHAGFSMEGGHRRR